MQWGDKIDGNLPFVFDEILIVIAYSSYLLANPIPLRYDNNRRTVFSVSWYSEEVRAWQRRT